MSHRQTRIRERLAGREKPKAESFSRLTEAFGLALDKASGVNAHLDQALAGEKARNRMKREIASHAPQWNVWDGPCSKLLRFGAWTETEARAYAFEAGLRWTERERIRLMWAHTEHLPPSEWRPDLRTVRDVGYLAIAFAGRKLYHFDTSMVPTPDERIWMGLFRRHGKIAAYELGVTHEIDPNYNRR